MPRSGNRLAFPWLGCAAARTSLALGLLLLGGCASPPKPVGEASVARAVVELGYPEVVTLGVRWLPETALPADPWVFVHLLDAAGEVVRTFDHPFPEEWRPGKVVEYDLELYQSALAPPLPPGDYRLTLGLYRPGDGRWALRMAAPEVGAQEYEVARVGVPEPRAESPRFRFQEPWRPLEAGTDLQILGRRWLVGSGEIRVDDLAGPGVAHLMLLIPGEEDTGGHLIVDPEADEVAVRVSCDCSGCETLVTGVGDHTVEMPLEPAPDGSPCRISISPNFDLLLPETLERRSIRLDLLAWRPAD